MMGATRESIKIEVVKRVTARKTALVSEYFIQVYNDKGVQIKTIPMNGKETSLVDALKIVGAMLQVGGI
jgi:hypothetical protein